MMHNFFTPTVNLAKTCRVLPHEFNGDRNDFVVLRGNWREEVDGPSGNRVFRQYNHDNVDATAVAGDPGWMDYFFAWRAQRVASRGDARSTFPVQSSTRSGVVSSAEFCANPLFLASFRLPRSRRERIDLLSGFWTTEPCRRTRFSNEHWRGLRTPRAPM